MCPNIGTCLVADDGSGCRPHCLKRFRAAKWQRWHLSQTKTCLGSRPTKMQGKGILGRENIWSKESSSCIHSVSLVWSEHKVCEDWGSSLNTVPCSWLAPGTHWSYTPIVRSPTRSGPRPFWGRGMAACPSSMLILLSVPLYLPCNPSKMKALAGPRSV